MRNIAIPVVENIFIKTLIRELGIDTERTMVGDATIDCPISGVFSLSLKVLISPEAWNAACKAQADLPAGDPK